MSRSFRIRLTGIAASVAALALIAPATSQPADPPAPRSLLPKGFSPTPAPASAPEAAPLPGTTPPPPPARETTSAISGTITLPENGPAPLADTETITAPFSASVPLPTSAPISAAAGRLSPANGGHGAAAFAAANGPFLAALARRVQVPIASRWAAINLRQAFLSPAPGPDRLSRGDWVAARALLLMRLGDIDAAKLLLDRFPVEAYSVSTYRVAGQAALAAADLGALCPIARTGRELSRDPLWELALGMCAALEGDDISAAALFDRLQQKRGGVSPFDVRLGERVTTMAGSGGRATAINWSEAPPLTPYRFGVALGSGVTVPATALEALGPSRHGWIIRQPALAPEIRLAALPIAAVQGNASAQDLVSGIALLDTADDMESQAARLRAAFAGANVATRVKAMQAIWASKVPGLDADSSKYAALIQTAPAAARLKISADAEDAAADIVASLLAAGNFNAARRWWPVAEAASSEVRARAWALLAVSGGLAPTPDGFEDWKSDTEASDRTASRLFAALTGLGLTKGSGWSGLAATYLPKAQTVWSKAIITAGQRQQSGAVALLAVTGLQGAWADVPPLHVLAITQALTASGRSKDAKLFAAEALTRS